MIFRYKYPFILGFILISYVGIDLLSLILRPAFVSLGIISAFRIFIGAISIVLLFLVHYYFVYRLKIDEHGISKEARIISQIFLFHVLKTSSLIDNIEYPWTHIKRVEAGYQWLRKSIIVVMKIDKKEERFVISSYMKDYEIIFRDIEKYVDPYFIDDEAKKVLNP